jgi:hypothetical protein
MRNKGMLGIGAIVSVGKKQGVVCGHLTASEYLRQLPDERVSDEAMRIEAAYGVEWKQKFAVYNVEFESGDVISIEAQALEVIDAGYNEYPSQRAP